MVAAGEGPRLRSRRTLAKFEKKNNDEIHSHVDNEESHSNGKEMFLYVQCLLAL